MIIRNSNIRRSIFENRYVIFIVIFAIVLVLYLIQMLNNNKKEQPTIQNNEIQNTVIEQEKDTSARPVITGNEISKDKQETNTKIIEQFITYCNNKEIEQAYNLLTDECKEKIFFSNIQYFKQNYVDRVFTTKKMYSIQSWISGYINTYRITIQDDILSAGKLNSSQDKIEDYYTIIEQGNGYKLNINSYIRRVQINTQRQVNGISITVLCKDVYKEYETYDVVIGNLTSKNILIDSKEKVDSIYLVGANESNYYAYSYEIDINDSVIEPQKSKKFTIKFNKIYSNKVAMKQMVFSDIIMDYEEYKNTQNKKEYTNRLKLTIEI